VPARPADTGGGSWSTDYLRGYRDGVNAVLDRLIADGGGRAGGTLPQVAQTELTWGLQAVRATGTRWTGAGVRVAVLDTGMDLGHPDFESRPIEARSFVAGEEVQDGNGHGTHCIGTACGPQVPHRLPRYGVAGNALIHAGKVLSDQGSGSDGGILAGIDWAVASGCAVVSMSLGAPVQAGETPSAIFEQVGQRALRAGTLIVAAAGNDSQRPNRLSPVGHPANCPSIMAVAALDERLEVAWFSCAGLNPQGGQVDIAAPGVAVYSAWPGTLYNTISGTSMATPHVAGIAALLAEADPTARGHVLWTRLVQAAHRLDQPARDVGAGLAQAPA
jgi:subtilisin family serine protease